MILCSVLDDMKANKVRSAILVSEDKAFKNSGVIALERDAGVTLKVLATLDGLEQLLRANLGDAIRRALDKRRQRLMEALGACRDKLETYLVKNLTFTPDELEVFGTMRRVGAIRMLSIDNAHASQLDKLSGPPHPSRSQSAPP